MTATASSSPHPLTDLPVATPLSARFAALQAEREANWPPAQLSANAHQRKLLLDAHDAQNHPLPGAPIAPFTLIGADGAAITQNDLAPNGPAVLLFYRFGTCPACNIALPYYQEALWPSLKAAGIPLLAISAQTPVDTGIALRGNLTFPLASDPDYALAQRLGITFFPEAQPPVEPGQDWIGATLGTNSYEMVQPAAVILNADGTLRHLIVSPDWLDRPEAEDILAHLPEVA
ncbi:peroxiredoxin-like family protein [Novosphingobium rosa]|uniref:peroxiredoxin-like family protein n=1 Tax=Novosphingobium rosa TaxID=76978 RepID=UPI0008297A0F|nr:peroxiredoxin-like family protein [Novosphingobium rosa]